ncbi:class I SAM-dependent methyltransferase [Candidatus Woesearchaeota archaeon]|nr:class I SAM-dependent methyltransferase [Candidatus Woesearchaeota archaeon]
MYLLERIRDIRLTIDEILEGRILSPKNLDGKVLDCFSGSGAGVYVIKQFGGEVVGVELDSSAIEEIKNGDGLNIVCGSCFWYLNNLERESLDLITNFAVPEYFDLSEFHELAKKIIKVGGQIIITSGYETREKMRRLSEGILIEKEDWTKRRYDTFIHVFTKGSN